MAFLQLGSLLVAAYPTQEFTHMARDDTHPVSLDDPPSRRTIVVAFCIGFAFLLALAQGYRAGRMAGRKSSAQFSDILVFAQGFVSISFVFAIGVNSAGLGLQTDAQCHAAIRVCIAMYGAAKITLYLFLLERVHVLRAPFVDRLRDPVWVIGVILTVGGYAGIMGFQFMSPRADLSRVDGVCRIGIQPDAGLAIITLDTTINLALTVIFIWQLRPTLGKSILPWSSNRHPNLASESRGRSPWRPFRARSNNNQREVSSAWLASHRSVRAMLMRNVIADTC
ncbi:hypothetical protein E8E13_004931 [Curvularia kusanoi]|uniref:Uncharacterized protein n=1 Tax=Curvularia kusanoi TaxID=90978 RepID=A0A9P4WC14_CURKU|nr:hypothetical protein E8E13_004931 [Curvularia kusanoi]